MTDVHGTGRRLPLRVGVIGFGAIGRRLAEAIVAGEAGRCELRAVLVRRPERIDAETVARLGCMVTADAADFLATSLDLVVEVAGHDALKAYAEDVLRQGKDLLLISVGALADAHFEARLHRAAHDYGQRVYLATGAIAGLDAIKGACVGQVDFVRLTSRKPPRALNGAPFLAKNGISLDGLEEEKLLFSGPATSLLHQGTYDFSHPRFGTHTIFIVPVGRDATGVNYEAVFS